MSWKTALQTGQVIPACPLTLFDDGRWSPRHQRAVLRYYIASGAGGVAVGVHSTQFAIRDPQHGLFEPLLKQASQWIDAALPQENSFIKIAGICGATPQALREAELAVEAGYHAGLLSLSALKSAPEEALIAHCLEVSRCLPIIGFYLQPAVGGRLLTYSFWRSLAEQVDQLIAIKIAPFNRYQTWDVIRAVMDAGRDDIALYTGNDDNIILDLLTPWQHDGKTRYIVGGLLGQWGVWTSRAVQLLAELKSCRNRPVLDTRWLSRNVALTDANAALFDAAHNFHGCIPGIMEVLRRQGLAPSNRCLNPEEVLSPGQAQELDRVRQACPELVDDDFVRENLEHWLSDS